MQLHSRVLGYLGVAMAIAGCSNDGDETKTGRATEQGGIATYELKLQLPLCTALNVGSVYYVSSEAQFYFCDARSLRPLDLKGPPVNDWRVALGGASTTQCKTGGILVQVGPDTNRNGSLDVAEVVSSAPVCNGKDGADGRDGTNGKDGADGQDGADGNDGAAGVAFNSLVNLRAASSTDCPAGGQTLESGLDDGTPSGTARDGILQAGEVDAAAHVCAPSGSGGEAGAGGTDAGPGCTGEFEALHWNGVEYACGDVRCLSDNGGCGDPAEFKCVPQADAAPECHKIRCVVSIAVGDDLRSKLASAAAQGCDVELAGGVHDVSTGLRLTFVGEAHSPFEIRSAPGQRAHLKAASDHITTVLADGSSHLILRGLEISGGDRGLRLSGSTANVKVEDCLIHDTAQSGIVLNGVATSYSNIDIIRNELRSTGVYQPIYIGCSDGTCPVDGVNVIGNYVHDTSSGSSSEGIEVKPGSSGVVIRDNVVHGVDGSCINVGAAAPGGDALIDGNLVSRCGDVGIRTAAHVKVTNNVVFGSIEVIRALQDPSLDADSHVTIANNTVVAAETAVRVTYANGTTVANNALFAPTGFALQVSASAGPGLLAISNVGQGNVTAGYESALALGNIATDFASQDPTVAPRNVFPSVGSALLNRAATQFLPERDYNGTLRAGSADVGAYRYSASGNPGPALTDGFKR